MRCALRKCDACACSSIESNAAIDTAFKRRNHGTGKAVFAMILQKYIVLLCPDFCRDKKRNRIGRIFAAAIEVNIAAIKHKRAVASIFSI